MTAPPLDFRALFEAAPGLYLVLEPDLRIVAVSNAYLAATMTTREEIVGKPLFTVFPDNPDDPTASGTRNLRASLSTVLQTGKPHTMAVQKYDIRRPDAEGGGFEERYWSPVNTPVFSSEQLTHIIHRVEDVTDFVRLQRQQQENDRANDELRSRAENTRIELYLRTHELEQAKLQGYVSRHEMTGLTRRANLYLLLMQAPAAVCVLRGARHVIELANAQFQRFTGGREILGHPIREALPDYLQGPLVEPLDLAFATGESQVRSEVPLILDRGQGLEDGIFSVVYQPMHGMEGAVEGVVVFAFDITGQVQSRQRLEALAETLRHADRAKDEFIAIISHELRTPMTSILGWTRMLALGDLDDETKKTAFDALERSTRSQAKLIEDLLDESRIASGKLRLDLRALDLVDVAEAAVAQARPLAEAKNLTLALDMRADACDVFGDPLRLQQVVGNVLGNAIKFTPDHGRINVRIRRDGTAGVIEVSDDGRGITADLLPHVFDRFRQGESDLGPRHSGLGLGLAITRHIVEMHGGTVRASSQGEGRGATITLYLPLHEATTTIPEFVGRDPRARSISLPQLDGVRILIIEDEIDNRNVLATALKRCGSAVACAGTAAAGLAMIAEFNPDVLICDIALPDLDGCTFLERLRAGGQTIPALALTVLGRPGEQARIIEAGFEVFRQKPIDPIDLAHEVARLAGMPESQAAE